MTANPGFIQPQAAGKKFANQEQSGEDLSLPSTLLAFCPLPLASTTLDTLFQQLVATIPWQDDFIEVFGRRFPIPRRQAWFADPGIQYRYSDNLLSTQPWMPELESLRLLVEQATGQRFNAVLATYYRSGQDSVSWHADDEQELGAKPYIASLSLGASRCFEYCLKPEFRPATANREQPEVFQLPLNHGDLLLMQPEFQQRWLHQVPQENGIMQGRINLTFRLVLNSSNESTETRVARSQS